MAETEIGEGQTCQWVIGSLDKNTSIAFYFDVTNQQSNTMPQGKQERRASCHSSCQVSAVGEALSQICQRRERARRLAKSVLSLRVSVT